MPLELLPSEEVFEASPAPATIVTIMTMLTMIATSSATAPRTMPASAKPRRGVLRVSVTIPTTAARIAGTNAPKLGPGMIAKTTATIPSTRAATAMPDFGGVGGLVTDGWVAAVAGAGGVGGSVPAGPGLWMSDMVTPCE